MGVISLKKKYLLVLCALAILCLTACNTEDNDVDNIEGTILLDPINANLDTATASMEHIYTAKSYEGEVNPSVMDLYFPEDGTFLEYPLSLGDHIEKGTVIARTDDKVLQEEIDILEENYELFLANYTYEKLKKETTLQISKYDLEIMNNSLIKAYEKDHKSYYDMEFLRIQIDDKKASIKRQELLLAQYIEIFALDDKNYQRNIIRLKEELGSNIIVAPFDGTIVALTSYAPGDSVDSKKPAIAYGDMNSAVVQCSYFNETSAKLSDRIYACIGDRQYDLTYIPYDLAVLNSLQIKGEIPVSTFTINHIDDQIKIGNSAIVVVISDEKESVLSVPSSAINKDNISTYVFKVENNIKSKVNVKTGINDGINTEILEGLLEGDVVYVGN